MEWIKDRDPVADFFDDLIARADRGEVELFMSMINVGEVYYNAAREWGMARAEQVLAQLRTSPIELVSARDQEVIAAARLKIKPGISYADGFAACLAIRLNCPLLTGDGDFRALETAGELRLEWLGA